MATMFLNLKTIDEKRRQNQASGLGGMGMDNREIRVDRYREDETRKRSKYVPIYLSNESISVSAHGIFINNKDKVKSSSPAEFRSIGASEQ